ncbi:unnamed protein product, partial [Porites evermanni]
CSLVSRQNHQENFNARLSLMMRVLQSRMILFFWIAVSCQSTQCPQNCKCSPFCEKVRVKCLERVVVKCNGTHKVPDRIPSNAVMLNLSGNSLESIEEDAFENLVLLKKIVLSKNHLRLIPPNTFRKLTSLTVVYLQRNLLQGGFYLPKTVTWLELQRNRLSYDDLQVILKELKQLVFLNLGFNNIGPVLTSDIFAGFYKVNFLSLRRCRLERIESGTFRAMQNLTSLDLSHNDLFEIQPGMLEGIGDKLTNFFAHHNNLRTIA